MADPTPAAAAPAAPAAAPAPAAPAAPAPAAVTPPAAPAAPAPAPAATDPPAAAPAAVAPPAPGDSILDNAADPPAAPQTDAERLAAAKALVAKAEAAADPNGGQAWLLKDGVMGEGEKPAWFKSDKYKSVSAQAEAYVNLESRFGSFVGAPKANEKGEVVYQIAPALKDMVQADHPMLGEFNKWAAKAQLSEDGYNQMLGMLAQYDQGFAPDGNVVRQAIGENADTRIGAVASWAKANLDAEGMAAFRTATSLDANMHPNARVAAALKAMEKAIAKTSQTRMPKPGPDVPGGQPQQGLAAIQAAHGAKTPDGKLKVDVDPAYRRQIDQQYRDYYAAQGQ